LKEGASLGRLLLSLLGEKSVKGGICKKKVVFRFLPWYNERAFVQKKE
jgi:hypothetical protein